MKKLDDFAIHAIRALRRLGFSRRSVALLYGVSSEMVVRIDTGENWDVIHTPDDYRPPQRSLDDAAKLRFGVSVERAGVIYYAKQLTTDIESPADREQAALDLLLSWAGIGGAKAEQDGQ